MFEGEAKVVASDSGEPALDGDQKSREREGAPGSLLLWVARRSPGSLLLSPLFTDLRGSELFLI